LKSSYIKWLILPFLLLSLFLLFFFRGSKRVPQPVIFPPDRPFCVYFSPQDSLYPHLVYLIQQAKKSIDAAFYKIELKEVSRALIEAHKRGVRVRVITDDSTSWNSKSHFSSLYEFGIIKRDKDPESLMHHKFCIIDEEIVWTGSFNPTPNGAFKENNNVVIIKSSSLAANFGEEFKKLWEENISSSPVLIYPYSRVLSIDGMKVESYFSPEDNLEEAVIKELKEAKESIHFALFSFTSSPIANALIHKYAQNIEVKGLLEKEQDNFFSQYHPLAKLKMKVRWDKNFHFMHHKFFIIDKKIVITGSFNPTWRGTHQNRENLLIIRSPYLAEKYEEEFKGMWEKWYNNK